MKIYKLRSYKKNLSLRYMSDYIDFLLHGSLENSDSDDIVIIVPVEILTLIVAILVNHHSLLNPRGLSTHNLS